MGGLDGGTWEFPRSIGQAGLDGANFGLTKCFLSPPIEKRNLKKKRMHGADLNFVEARIPLARIS